MNQLALTTIVLLILTTFTFGQPAKLDTPDPDNSLVQVFESAPDDAPSTAYVPLNNVPFFPGGQKALETYLNDCKPANARQLEGTVHVRFRVMPTGDLAEISIIQSSEPLLNRVAWQAIAQMPRWYPAHRSGVAVSSLYILPITFRLP